MCKGMEGESDLKLEISKPNLIASLVRPNPNFFFFPCSRGQLHVFSRAIADNSTTSPIDSGIAGVSAETGSF